MKAGKRIDDSVVSFCQFASLIEYMVEDHSVDLRIPSFLVKDTIVNYSIILH